MAAGLIDGTALGLARIGAIDKHTLRELDALCLPLYANFQRSKFGPFAAGPK